MSIFIYFYQWFLLSYYHLLFGQWPSPTSLTVGQAVSTSVTCKKPQRALKTKGPTMTTMMKVAMRLGGHAEGVCSGWKRWGVRDCWRICFFLFLSLNLQFYHIFSGIFRMFTLHEKWLLRRIPIRVPTIPSAHKSSRFNTVVSSDRSTTCIILQRHLHSTLS